jgi:hypothetical protein
MGIEKTIWLRERKRYHLVREQSNEYVEDRWNIVWNEYICTGKIREDDDYYEYQFIGQTYL